MSINDKMPRIPVKCYVMNAQWNGKTVEVMYVPKYNNPELFVGPGYWSPPRAKDVFAPRCKYHHKAYTKADLIDAGATERVEALWR